MTTVKLHNDTVTSEQHDPWIKERLDFMFDYFDYKNDRTRVRERFVQNMNKKTTVEDIGFLLDQWSLDSKANQEFFQ